jgi:phage tail sheath protein FI
MPEYRSPGVYIEELEAGSRPIEGVGTAVAAFVGFAADGDHHQPTLVTNWSQFTRQFGSHIDGSYLAHSVYSYFDNGGGSAYIVRVPDGCASTAAPAMAELCAAGDASLPSHRIVAIQPGVEGNDVTVEVTELEGDAVKLVVNGSGREEVFEPVTATRGRRNIATVVNAQSTLIRVEETTGTVATRPAAGVVRLQGGDPGGRAALTAQEYVGNTADRTGFAGLEVLDNVTMLCVPDLMAAYERGLLDLDGVQAVQLAMISHCEKMGDRMAILDPPPGLGPQQVLDWRVQGAGYDSKYAALYWPYVNVMDPVTATVRPVPPSGHIAGIWARNDAGRGVHKAPANEVVRGALGPAMQITKPEHDLLNPAGVNCLRAFPARGTRVWGARTLSSDAAWRYVNVRRLFNYIEGSLLAGTQWAVFEPNDQDLWGRLKRTITAFLYRVWLDGALFGATPQEAFYVRCDAETNPSEVIEAGSVVVEIGIAAVKPAEFVVFRLAQLPTGTSAVSE